MPKRKKQKKQKPIEQFTHKDKDRLNNPPVGLVTPETDKDLDKKKYEYDEHLNPELVWAGKAEHTSFEVPTVSLHIHERIDPKTIIEAVRKKSEDDMQISFFEDKRPLREVIDFYKHKDNWSNRLIAGDSLLVMNSLLEKEGMADEVQMVYMDPPYGITYKSNFQPFVNQKNVTEGRDEDLTQEPEMIKAFRDTWELGIHSYLTYMRDRLRLSKKLLKKTGSIFVQIGDENIHHIKELLDEIFGPENFIAIISFQTAANQNTETIQRLFDHILWYAKEKKSITIRKCFRKRESHEITKMFTKKDNDEEYRAVNIESYSKKEVTNLKTAGRLTSDKKFAKLLPSDFPYREIHNVWEDTVFGHAKASEKIYVVQTNNKVIQRCLLMTTEPGDIVLDPTCGSGTTGWVAEKWGRRWITCDTSRVALTLAKQRLMTSIYEYYELAYKNEGISSGLKYMSVPKITIDSIAKEETIKEVIMYDKPYIDKTRVRISGPFTVEAVPAPTVRSLDETKKEIEPDVSIARSGETLRQSEWRDELLNNGVRGKGKQYMLFSRVEPMTGTRYIQAEAETKTGKDKARQRVFIVFGPEHAPLEQRQVALALDEAQSIRPKADIILFAAFQFDPEAAKDIDETKWTGVKLLRVQMNADLFTDDLKKKRTSDDSFWLLGQPDIQIKKIDKGKDKGKFQVEVKGFDYYDTKTGNVISGSDKNIAVWMLDTDYDGRSLFPKQVFFPMSSDKDGWSKLAKNLKAEIDEELIEAYRGTVSLPFTAGENKQCAVKIVDDRGIESLRIIKI